MDCHWSEIVSRTGKFIEYFRRWNSVVEANTVDFCVICLSNIIVEMFIKRSFEITFCLLPTIGIVQVWCTDYLELSRKTGSSTFSHEKPMC